jgi:hypothetical protein
VTLQFILHENGGLTGSRAETPRHYIFMGIATDHDAAVQLALKDALDFRQADKGLSPADAMAFASLAVDLDIAESVDFTVLTRTESFSFGLTESIDRIILFVARALDVFSYLPSESFDVVTARLKRDLVPDERQIVDAVWLACQSQR